VRIGLLGYEQAGKRTLFTLLTGRAVPETRRPGEVLEGVAKLRDPRVDVLATICKPERVVYAENHFVLCPDVAQGAAQREWLEAARRCDLLCIVVRAFASDDVYHPAGSVDAARDRAALEAELVLTDLMVIEQRLERLEREVKNGRTRAITVEQTALGKLKATLEAERPASEAGLDAEEQAGLRHVGLLCNVPVLWTYNVAEDEATRDFGPGSFAVSARIESEIAQLSDPAERSEYLGTLGLASSGLDRMNAAAYDALGLMSFYTIGEDEARAWTIRKGANAPTAGGKIHSDIERGFIRVEIMKYDDLAAIGSEKLARERGKVQVKGRDYVMEDGDVCHFLFNV
jgi:GTP-binding protein YchF